MVLCWRPHPNCNTYFFSKREESRRTPTSLHTLKSVVLTSSAQCTLLLLYTIYRYPFLDSGAYRHLHRISSTENATGSSGRSYYSPWKQSFPASLRCWAVVCLSIIPKLQECCKRFLWKYKVLMPPLPGHSSYTQNMV